MPLEQTRPASDADRLRAQAATLEEAMIRHRRQADELKSEIIDLRVQADRLDRAPVTIMAAAAPPPERDTNALDKITEAIRAGANTSTLIAEHSGLSIARVRAGLARLEEVGTIVRTGLKRGTRYHMATDDVQADAKTVREFGNYQTAIRDAAVKLDLFGIEEMQAELPDVSEHTLRRWLRHLVGRGVLTSERVDGKTVWAHERATGPNKARPRHATPEEEARRNAPPVPRRGAAVAGTGRARVGTPVVDELIREAAEFGVTVTTSKHRVEYRRNGRVIATSSKTPGASHLGGTRKQLRDAGVPVAP